MTTLVAVKNSGDTWCLGSDSGTYDSCVVLDYGSKWLQSKAWALGVSGDLATLTILNNDARNNWLSEAGTAFDVRQGIEERLKAANYATGKHDEGPPRYGQNFILVGSPGLFLIGTNLEVLTIKDSYMVMAEGSGQAYALGALHAMRGYSMAAPDRVKIALAAAFAFDPNTRGRPIINMWEPEA